jgi:quercetin dioxygenase-like cupin family protein
MPDIAPLVRPLSAVPAVQVDRARGASMRVLVGPDDGADRLVTRCFTLEVGGRIPCHRHADIEHQQVVLEGEMVVSLDGSERFVRALDCLLIPAGTAHWYENRGDRPVRFLCVIPRTDSYATEWLE